MCRSNKISWKLLVLVALVSSFIFCSEVCADNCVKDAKAAQNEEVKEVAEVAEVAEVEEVEVKVDDEKVEVEVEEVEVEE
jgi:cytochrome c biogenesis protein ResB